MKSTARLFVPLLLALLPCATFTAPAAAQQPPDPSKQGVTQPTPGNTQSPNQAPGQTAGQPEGPASSLPDPRLDSHFATAVKLAQEQTLDKAYDEYVKVKNDNDTANPALAADAILRAALLGYNALVSPPTQEFLKLPPDAQETTKDRQTDIARKSHEILRQLKDEPKLAETQVATYVLEPHWINVETNKPADLKTAIESVIDRRNSHTISYQIVDMLVRLTGAVPSFSYWFALVLIAVIVKAITFPLTLRTYKSQREMQRIQPLLKKLQEQYKGKPEMNEKMMQFYKEHNVNPMASCFPMLVQIPFMWFVYDTIRLYEYHFSHGTFLWIGSSLAHQYPAYVAGNLAKFDVPLLVIYAASNYLTMKLNPSPDPAQAQQQQMMSLATTLMFFFMFMKYQWSAAFIFYWLILNFISAFQQYNYIYKPNRLKAKLAVDSAADTPAKTLGSAPVVTEPRPVTPIPGGNAVRPRPKARKRK